MKVLITETLAEEGVRRLRKAGLAVDIKVGLSSGELSSIISSYEAVIIRSATTITKEVIDKASSLEVIGRAGVGVDNVDLEAATRRGIIVMNTPGGNAISAAEHTMAMILSLSRNIPQANNSFRSRKWERGRFVGTELYEKTLGIIGLGRVGSEVAKRALAFGMEIVAYDPFISEEKLRGLKVKLTHLEDLLRCSDYISIHAPLRSETHHLIREQEFKMMKKGVRIINCARGGIIDEGALFKAIKEGRVQGAALDVYEREPPFDTVLIELDSVIFTPHLGASTREAQTQVSIQIADQIIDVLKERGVRNAVNLPSFDLEMLEEINPWTSLAEKMGSLLCQLLRSPIEKVNITYVGEMNQYNIGLITGSLLKGLLEPILEEKINYVNALAVAKERGIKLAEIKSDQIEDFSNLLTVKLLTASGEVSLAGTLFSIKDPRIVRIDEYHVEVVPEGNIFICFNEDKPGAIAHITGILAEEGINIASMGVGRKKIGGKAITVFNLDTPVSSSLIEKIKASPIILETKMVKI